MWAFASKRGRSQLQFRDLFTGRSANNGGFLAAILRFEGILIVDEKRQFAHTLSPDWEKWPATAAKWKPVPKTKLILPAEKPGNGNPKEKAKDVTQKGETKVIEPATSATPPEEPDTDTP